MLEHSRLREILDYNPETGVFRWKTGKIAGGLDKDGYRRIKIAGKYYRGGRLAWFYVYGFWPPQTIDHRDRNKTNNAIDNLRLATQAQQGQNRGAFGATGLKGVTRTHKKWVARIRISGKLVYLGTFDDPVAAYIAYETKAVEIFGEFAS